ncbi:MAG: thiamine-phosphate kinase [Desulfobulbus sp.]|nr:thiamine-phosphate kinase [Desulfobulbus sp.]
MNERQIIDHIATLVNQADERLLKGIGDDCAVVAKDGRLVWLLTVDTIIEGVHFDPTFHPPEKLGRKVVSVNVSDIGAMGGRPLFALLSVGLPRTFDPSWFRAFARGLADGCREYGCLLIGGDTVASPQGFNCSLTVIGEAAIDQVVYRNGARPNDAIWVSGPLGFAAAGLELLRRRLDVASPALAPLLAKHLDPPARVELGRQLGESGLVHAMMDLSDGLATDLAHLCKQSGVGARIAAWDLPISPALIEAARLTGANPEQWAVGGGEDYELLFTAAADAHDHLLALGRRCGLPFAPIGTIVEGAGVVLLRRGADETLEECEIAYQGYDHFYGNIG